MLLLIESFYTKALVEARSDFDTNGPMDGTLIDTSFNFFKVDDVDNEYFASTSIASSDESKNPPYNFSLVMAGRFRSSTDDFNEKAARAIAFQMMVSSIRETVSLLTGRGPWPTFSLGMIDVSFAWVGMDDSEKI